jgi:fructose-1,6-bisphosphatase/inositol monophosphatase family enzyme
MDPIKILESLEPIFMEGAKLGAKMQGTAKHHNKTNTGLAVADIVTEGDLAVQEFVLKEIAKTELINCHMLAEEDTETANVFKGQNNFYIGIDPIDGTAVYARGGKQFSIIITLHDDKNLLYTFKYFPVFDWVQKIVGSSFITHGQQPEFKLEADPKNKIFFYTGNPQEKFPEIAKELFDKGMVFENCANSLADVDEASLFASGKCAGFYSENPNAYDGLVSLHFALSQNCKAYLGGPNGTIDFTNIQKRATGLYYPGYYLVLND